MSSEAVSIADAARELGVSARTIRRMVESGNIEVFRTHGGHVRIPVESLRAIKRPGSHDRRGPAAGPNSSSVLQNRRERVEELALEAQELRARREIEKLRREAAAEEQDRQAEAEALRLEAAREAQVMALERERVASERAEAERRRLDQAEASDRRARFLSRWMKTGLEMVPPDVPGQTLCEVRSQLIAALEQCDDSEPEVAVQHLVRATVDHALAPWQRQKAVATIVQASVETLPLNMRGFSSSLTEWGLKAKQAALQAVSALREGTTLDEVTTAARLAVNATAREFQRQQQKAGYLDQWFLYVELNDSLQKLLRNEELELDPKETVQDVIQSLRPRICGQLEKELDGTESREHVSRRIGELVRAQFEL